MAGSRDINSFNRPFSHSERWSRHLGIHRSGLRAISVTIWAPHRLPASPRSHVLIAPHWEVPTCLDPRPAWFTDRTRKTGCVGRQGGRGCWEGQEGSTVWALALCSEKRSNCSKVESVGLEPKSFLLLTTMACCYCHLLFIHSWVHFLKFLEPHREWGKNSF